MLPIATTQSRRWCCPTCDVVHTALLLLPRHFHAAQVSATAFSWESGGDKLCRKRGRNRMVTAGRGEPSPLKKKNREKRRRLKRIQQQRCSSRVVRLLGAVRADSRHWNRLPPRPHGAESVKAAMTPRSPLAAAWWKSLRGFFFSFFLLLPLGPPIRGDRFWLLPSVTAR